MGKLFGTDGIRGVVGETRTAELAYHVGRAVTTVLTERLGHKPVITIGKDTRISSDMLESALIAGICCAGGDVMPLGTIPTPAVAFLTVQEQADAGIVISASHNPYEHNGIKVFNGQGYKLPDAMEAAVEDLVLYHANMPVKTRGEIGTRFHGMRQMKKEGIYADKLTDSYIYDVVHSAPLHDVGKITISDTILNKPGRLNDEEFAIMKTHAASGETIIDRVIDTMREESNYLNEAKNLAAYHHEKWDGTGYPKGLKGEEIPLSARVMAVADVFDALVSRRCYKSPYPVEKSLEIIRESSGTHFDPLVVKAFLDAEDEVRQVASLNLDSYDYKQHNL